LYADQELLNAHLSYPSFYKTGLEEVTCINPEARISILKLSAAVMARSASSAQQGWLLEKVEHQHLKEAVQTKLVNISEKLESMDSKLSQVLHQMRLRFDSLSCCAVQLAKSLRRDILLGNQRAQGLPDMISATQHALQRLSAFSEAREHSHGPTVAELQKCLSSMQASMEAAVSRTIEKQKVSIACEYRNLTADLLNRFGELLAELRMGMPEQRNNGVLNQTCECMKSGLTEVLHSLRGIEGELQELRNDQAALGRCISNVLDGNRELNAMVHTLLADTHGIPTLAIILPVVSTSWKSRFSPMRVVRDRYRLYFLCSHTHQIAPCGPKGKGYKITTTKQWVLDAAPVLRVGLVLLKVALLASGLPLPVPDLSSLLVGSKVHAQYLNAALQLVTHPPDGAVEIADIVMQQTLDAIDAHDYSDLLHITAGQETRLLEGSRKAYRAIERLLAEEGEDIGLTCGLRQVTHRGKTAWVLDSDATERDWRSAVDSAVP
jgi:hypothetical protein